MFAQFGMNPDNPMVKLSQDIMGNASKNLNMAGDAFSKISTQSGAAQGVSKACVINDEIAKELDFIESALFYFRFDSITCIPLTTAMEATIKTMKKCEKILTEGLQPSSMEILDDVSKTIAKSQQIITSCQLFPHP